MCSARTLQKQIVSKLLVRIFDKSCNNNKFETENIFLREESIVKKPKTAGVGDQNLGTVDNRITHIFFYLALSFLVCYS